MDTRLFLSFVVALLTPTAICDPFNLHGKLGQFSNVHFPSYYENNLNQTWTVTVEIGYYVELYFNSFDLEDSIDGDQRCAFDYVELFDGDTNSNTSSGRMCGNWKLYPDDAPQPYVYKFRTSGNIATLKFVSDYSNDLPGSPTPTGFQVTFQAQDIDECAVLEEKYAHALYPEKVGKCDHYCNNFMGMYTCSCKDGYELAPDGYTCRGKCSGVYTHETSGYITSPGYPKPYPKETDCDWTIETDIGRVIELNFVEQFSIENYLTTAACPYDWLKIDNGKSVETFCGINATADAIVSIGNIAKIQFHSDKVQELKGFKLSYRARGVYCPLPTPPDHGRISETYGAERGSLPFDSVVVFECENGYYMKGEHKITCLKDGSFDDVVPMCVQEK